MKQPNIGHQIEYKDMVKLLDSYGDHHNEVVRHKDDNDKTEYDKHLMVCEEVEKWMKACGIVPNKLMVEARKIFI